MSREFIESIDGGRVHFDEEEDNEADAFNSDTFGDDSVEGFFDAPPGLTHPLNDHVRLRDPVISPPTISSRPTDHLIAPPSISARLTDPVISRVSDRNLAPWDRVHTSPAPPPPPPPRSLVQPEFVRIPAPFVIPQPVQPEFVRIPAPFVIPEPVQPEGVEISAQPKIPSMSIHAVPVRVFPTPFTNLQKQQALSKSLDIHKWGKQEEFVRAELMTRRDKEFVTKIQLNQMVALSGSKVQDFRGQFTFGRTTTRTADPNQDANNLLGKRLYSSVYHPRKLLSLNNQTCLSSPAAKTPRDFAEKCFDLLLDVDDVDEYISGLHPLAEDKINEAIIERTELLEKVVNILREASLDWCNAKLEAAKDRTIQAIVQLVQPRQASTSSEAEARRSLIFRRVPEAVKGFYIDMLEAIVVDDNHH